MTGCSPRALRRRPTLDHEDRFARNHRSCSTKEVVCATYVFEIANRHRRVLVTSEELQHFGDANVRCVADRQRTGNSDARCSRHVHERRHKVSALRGDADRTWRRIWADYLQAQVRRRADEALSVRTGDSDSPRDGQIHESSLGFGTILVRLAISRGRHERSTHTLVGECRENPLVRFSWRAYERNVDGSFGHFRDI